LVDEKDDFLELVSFRVGDQVAEVFAEFDVSSTFVAVPDDVFLWPEHGDEKVTSFGISQGWYQELLVFAKPASFDAGEKFNPFFILETYRYPFLKRAGATFLYRRTSARFL
jgi:hypothetical protein